MTHLLVADVLLGQFLLVHLEHLDVLLLLFLALLQLVVLLDQFHRLVGHLRELRIDRHILADRTFRRLRHLLVGDLAELSRDLVHSHHHVLLEPVHTTQQC